jgi:hypothetical protein
MDLYSPKIGFFAESPKIGFWVEINFQKSKCKTVNIYGLYKPYFSDEIGFGKLKSKKECILSRHIVPGAILRHGGHQNHKKKAYSKSQAFFLFPYTCSTR